MDENKPRVFRETIRFSTHIKTSDPAYTRELYRLLKRNLSKKLFDILEQCLNPALVEIGDLKEKVDPWNGSITVAYIDVRVTPNQRHDGWVVPVRPDISFPPDVVLPGRKVGFWKRLKWLVEGEI